MGVKCILLYKLPKGVAPVREDVGTPRDASYCSFSILVCISCGQQLATAIVRWTMLVNASNQCGQGCMDACMVPCSKHTLYTAMSSMLLASWPLAEVPAAWLSYSLRFHPHADAVLQL